MATNGAAGNGLTPDAYTGEAVLKFGDRLVTLRMRYREIAALRSEFGAEWPDRYREAVDGDAALTAKILAIMTGLSEDEVLDLVPAGHLAVAEAMLDMYLVAQHGPAWREKRAEAQSAAAEVEQSPLLRRLIQLLLRSRRQPDAESPPLTSGA